MWTKNGKKLFIKQLSTSFTSTSGNASSFIFRGCTGTDITMGFNALISGVANSVNYITADMTVTPSANNASYFLVWQLYIGTGTTPPTEEDITLEAPVAFTCPVAPQISRGDNQTTLLITYTFTNNTEETKTITEIGLCSRVVESTTNSPAVLFNRRLLDTPVVMNAGDAYAFTFRIDTSNLSD